MTPKKSNDLTPCLKRRLEGTPAPGVGLGCHGHILGTATKFIREGISPQDTFDYIRESIPRGKRCISDKEIWDSIYKVLNEESKGPFIPKPRPQPIINDGEAVRERLIKQATISTEADLRESSPSRLPEHPTAHTVWLLRNLYEPDDLIFNDDQYELGVLEKNIRKASEWIEYFSSGGGTKPFFLINPLNGIPMPLESGDGETLRGNKNVLFFKYVLLEFDNIPIESQIKFWTVVKLPIVALIFTGNKSIHALVDVQKLAPVNTLGDWENIIKERLYDRILSSFEIDKACANPARLSRLPGHFRADKEQYQRLLWLRRKEECKIIPLTTSRTR